MLLTVEELMKLKIMQSSKVLTAKDYLHHYSVESISVIEIPVEDFVRQNEFVLSTAIGIGDQPQLLEKFVRDIIESKAATLGIAIGHYVTKIPDNVLEMAEEHHFPIIHIPWEVRFSDISQAVLNEINKLQQLVLIRSEELQKKLLHLFLRKANLSDAAEIIHQMVERPTIIVDSEGLVRGKSKESESIVDLWHQYANLYPSADWQSFHTFSNVDIKTLTLDHHILVRTAVRSANINLGYILFTLPRESSAKSFFNNGEDRILEHASTSTALWFQRENTIKETEMKMRDDFVWRLAKTHMDTWESVYEQSKLLGFNIDIPYIAIVGIPENTETAFHHSNPYELTYEQWMQRTTRTIEEQIIQTGKSLKRRIMTTYQQNRFIIFLEFAPEETMKELHRYLDEVEDRMKKLFPDIIMSWGIGENQIGIKTFHHGYSDARLALEIGYRQKEPGHRSTYASTGIYRVLQSLTKDPELKKITAETIGELIKYDEKRGLDLTRTLMTYIRHQGNVSKTARTMNLHRQSLLYRLRKIESLTGRSLFDPDDLFLLDLSIKLWTMGSIKEV